MSVQLSAEKRSAVGSSLQQASNHHICTSLAEPGVFIGSEGRKCMLMAGHRQGQKKYKFSLWVEDSTWNRQSGPQAQAIPD